MEEYFFFCARVRVHVWMYAYLFVCAGAQVGAGVWWTGAGTQVGTGTDAYALVRAGV